MTDEHGSFDLIEWHRIWDAIAATVDAWPDDAERQTMLDASAGEGWRTAFLVHFEDDGFLSVKFGDLTILRGHWTQFGRDEFAARGAAN